jgi:hypothetical protein
MCPSRHESSLGSDHSRWLASGLGRTRRALTPLVMRCRYAGKTARCARTGNPRDDRPRSSRRRRLRCRRATWPILFPYRQHLPPWAVPSVGHARSAEPDAVLAARPPRGSRTAVLWLDKTPGRAVVVVVIDVPLAVRLLGGGRVIRGYSRHSPCSFRSWPCGQDLNRKQGLLRRATTARGYPRVKVAFHAWQRRPASGMDVSALRRIEASLQRAGQGAQGW